LGAGLVDHLVQGDTKAVLAKAEEVADQWAGNAKGGVWGIIKVMQAPFKSDHLSFSLPS